MNETPHPLDARRDAPRPVARPVKGDTPLPDAVSESGRSALPTALKTHPRYQIVARLGAGGMGTVYKARHRLMDRLVALKIINPALVGRPEAVRRFRQEMRAAARLTHPNIVTAYDAEQAGDTHFLVMEFVEGVSLDRVAAARGPLPVAEACAYARQAAVGLQHAHEGGMVHRDVKPHNLMLTPEGVVKILDFGLARFASEAPLGWVAPMPPSPAEQDAAAAEQEDYDFGSAPTRLKPRGEAVTSSETGLGTPDYLAPEEASDPRRADIRADIYSLGCTLYRLLAGQVPFPGGSLSDKVQAHRERRPRPLSELRPDVSAALAQVVERMMAKDAEQRYPTPGEAARALAPFAAPPGRHVLVVDDNAAVREVMTSALESQGYRVSTAVDGREALELLRRGPLPDLLLLDLMMPRMDGWEFLRERRHDPALAAVPVLIISALDVDQARAMALGVAGQMQKPIELNELGAAVRQHTAKG